MAKGKNKTDIYLQLLLIAFAGIVVSFVVMFFVSKLSLNFIANFMSISSGNVKKFFIFLVISSALCIFLSMIWSYLLTKISFKTLIKKTLSQRLTSFFFIIILILFGISSSIASGYNLTDSFINKSGLNPPRNIVPDLSGKTLDQALVIIAEHGFDTIPSANIHYFPIDSNIPESLVIKQDPPPGVNITSSSQIELWVNIEKHSVSFDSTPSVPHVEELSLERAMNLIKSKGFNVVVESIFSDTISHGRIIRTDPAGGDEPQQGNIITIFVSKGAFPIEVPDLLGKTIIEASENLTKIDLNISIRDERTSSLPPFTILEQFPEPGESLLAGSNVSVIISKEELTDTIEF